MKETLISSKYEFCWKSIKTEAVSNQIEMKNEWKVHFLQNTRCIEKVSRLKLYFPREKGTIDKGSFSSKYKMCKVSRLKLYLLSEKRAIDKTLIFPQIQSAFKTYRQHLCLR